MIFEIEKKLINLLKEHKINHYHIDYGKGLDIYSYPFVSLDIDSIEIKSISKGRYKVNLKIDLYLYSKNYRSDEDNRKAVYSIIEGILGLLYGNNLGLEIEPIILQSIINIASEELRIQKVIAFKIVMETSYVVDKAINEEIFGDLLRIGLKYYLQPDDERLDGSDLITLKFK